MSELERAHSAVDEERALKLKGEEDLDGEFESSRPARKAYIPKLKGDED